MNQLQFWGAIEIGLIFSLVAIGIYFTFKIIDFPDLTVDGSFTTGAAVTVAMISSNHNSYISTMIAMIAGSAAGAITGYLNVRWKIIGLLAGILTMTALYSINLRIMQKPNIAIIDNETIFGNHSIIYVTIIVLSLILVIFSRLFTSNFGLAIRAIGSNALISQTYGIDTSNVKIITLAISNGIIALAGSLFAQSQGFADISMGTGTIIIGLASVIIGEGLIPTRSVTIGLVACILGSVIYRIVIVIALNADNIGLKASDLNIITAAIVAITMMLSNSRKA